MSEEKTDTSDNIEESNVNSEKMMNLKTGRFF